MADALHLVAEAIAALGNHDPAGARLAMAAAVDADRNLAGVADAVHLAASILEAEGEVPASAWNAIADACPGEVRATVEAWRS